MLSTRVKYPPKIDPVCSRVLNAKTESEDYETQLFLQEAARNEIDGKDVKDGKGKILNLHAAVKKRDLELVTSLLKEKSFNISVLRNSNGDTASELAYTVWLATPKNCQEYKISAAILRITLISWTNSTH